MRLGVSSQHELVGALLSAQARVLLPQVKVTEEQAHWSAASLAAQAQAHNHECYALPLKICRVNKERFWVP
jgi:hypothetical protein